MNSTGADGDQRQQNRRFLLPRLFPHGDGRAILHHRRNQRPAGQRRDRPHHERAGAQPEDGYGHRRCFCGLYAGNVSPDDGCGNLRRRGRGYIVESNGEIVVASSSARFAETGNLLDGVADFSETGRQDGGARQVLAGEQPGGGRVLGTESCACCRKIENGRQDDTWYLVMVMGPTRSTGGCTACFRASATC